MEKPKEEQHKGKKGSGPKRGFTAEQLAAVTDKKISNRDLVLFALFVCGGAEQPVFTEDVAARVFRYPLGQQRFRWERHNYPDKEKVALELHRIENEKGITIVKGTVNIGAENDIKDGWVLTETGADSIKRIKLRLKKVLDSTGVRQRITSSECYKIYSADRTMVPANRHHFTDMLYRRSDASKASIDAAFDKLLENAKDIDATDLIEFLVIARVRFKDVGIKW